MQNLPFLGRGWSFPPTFYATTGAVGMLEQEADIASSLEILVTTRAGERIMLPEYGCNLDELVFEALDSTRKTLLADRIRAAILYFEPRIDLEEVAFDERREVEGVVLLELIYRVRTTNSRFNVVFPFYRDEGSDINAATTVNLLPDRQHP